MIMRMLSFCRRVRDWVKGFVERAMTERQLEEPELAEENLVRDVSVPVPMPKSEPRCAGRANVQVDGVLTGGDGRPVRTAIVYQSELDFISRCILDYPHIETGGQLFGFWTAAGIPVVLFAIGPGPRANHQAAFFNQDVDYLVRVGQMLIGRYGLQHIGEWHSHHQLGLARPSGHDAATMVHCIKRQNLRQFLLCIGNCTDTASELNAFAFTQDAGYDYVHAAWDVKTGASPFRTVIARDAALTALLTEPATVHPSIGAIYSVGDRATFVVPTYAAGYWLNTKANNLVLKRLVDHFAAFALPGSACVVQMDQGKCVHLRFDTKAGAMEIVFPQRFPLESPLVLRDGALCESAFARWEPADDLFADVCAYYDALTTVSGITTTTDIPDVSKGEKDGSIAL